MIGRLFGVAMALAVAQGAAAQDRPDQARFRSIYKELVETNTTLSVGSCTVAAHEMGARLKSAGFPDSDITYFATDDHPKDGGMVAVLHGRDPAAKAILLLGHLDVVEAKREDWTRDPFVLIEENGYFYGRGTSDMKVIDATWVDMLMRFKEQGFQPRHTLKLALTCGEETTRAFNGADWLAKTHPDWIAAEYALNEGGGGRADANGKVLTQGIQVGQKVVQQYRIETTNVGGHSSIPIRDNAIYELAAALLKVRDLEFPMQLSETTRAFLAKAGAGHDDPQSRAMVALANNPDDRAALAELDKDRNLHSMLRTTCVATLLDGGHAENALPQRAGANINCRMFPGRSMEETRAALVAAIDDPKVTVTPLQPIRDKPSPVPLDPKIMGPAEQVTAKYFPGVPLIPTMSNGATDAIHLSPIGIPTYGAPGLWSGPEGSGAHGLNEHISVKSVYVGRDYMTDLVKLYADAP